MKTRLLTLRFVAPVLAVITAGSLAGCGTSYRTADIIDTSKRKVMVWKTRRWWTIRADCYAFHINPYTYNPAAQGVSRYGNLTNTSESLYAIAVSASDEVAARDARNRLQDAIVNASMQETKQHLANLKATENDVNTFFGAAALGLSGGATVAAQETARALSAASTGVGGFRALFNEQTYRNALVDSLIMAIETDRAQFLEAVIRSKQKQSIHDYNVEAAIVDAEEFHKRGSFYYGLTLIRTDIDQANRSRAQTSVSHRSQSE